MLTVEYGGAFFHSDMRPASLGEFLIEKDGFEGWWGRPTTRSADVEHRSGHGGPLLPTLVGSRQVAVTGRFMRAGRSTRYLTDRLSGLPLAGRLTVQDDEGSQWATAQLIDVSVERAVENANAAFQLIWRCPDPHKYGESREIVSSGANVQAFHYGNADAWPIFTVTGFAGGYRIIGPGGTYQVGSKSAGAVDTIDFADGLLVRNGNHVTRQVSQRDVWPVKPFQQSQWRVQAVGSGSGTATMTLLDTYL